MPILRTKRLIKSPKLYLVDSGLAAFLAGDWDVDALGGSPLVGAYLEQVVLQHLAAETSLMVPSPSLHYWRTTDNKEVDVAVHPLSSAAALSRKLV